MPLLPIRLIPARKPQPRLLGRGNAFTAAGQAVLLSVLALNARTTTAGETHRIASLVRNLEWGA